MERYLENRMLPREHIPAPGPEPWFPLPTDELVIDLTDQPPDAEGADRPGGVRPEGG
jgi:hypothetical protein